MKKRLSFTHKTTTRPANALILLWIGFLMFLLNITTRDWLIIHHGIRAANTARILFCATGTIAELMAVIILIKAIRAHTKEKTIKNASDNDQNGIQTIDALSSAISTCVIQKWTSHNQISDLGAKVADQVDQIDVYAYKLEKLVEANRSADVIDANGLMDKAQTYMLKTNKRVLDYLELYAPDDQEDCDKMKDILSKAVADNSQCLKQIKDFIAAFVELANKPDEDNTVMQKLQLCRTTILDYLNDEPAFVAHANEDRKTESAPVPQARV